VADSCPSPENMKYLFNFDKAHMMPTPLYCASACGFSHVVRDLVKNGADVNARSPSGYWEYPLIASADRGHVSVAQCLLDAGADIASYDGALRTPLHCAASSGNGDMVKLLINAGADVNSQNDDGEFPLQFCVVHSGHSGHSGYSGYSDFEMASLSKLLLTEQSVRQQCVFNGWTVLHEVARIGYIETAKVFINAGLDVNERWGYDFYAGTPLHVAARHNEIEMIKFLVGVGADTRRRNFCDWMPVHSAAINGAVEAVHQLLNLMHPESAIPFDIASSWPDDEWVRPANIFPCCKRLVQLQPDDPMAYEVLGECYLKLGKPQLALRCFEKGLSCDPDNFGITRVRDIYHPVPCGVDIGLNHNSFAPIRGLRYKCAKCPPFVDHMDCGNQCTRCRRTCRSHKETPLIVIPSEKWIKSMGLTKDLDSDQSEENDLED
jgi:ankyrin repeat protein